MGMVLSKDGTQVEYARVGSGPAVILVDGALVSHSEWDSDPLPRALASRFSVIAYNRRGRGKSGNTLPYGVEREIEDLDALIQLAGGPVSLFGHSSGAALVLEAALRLGERVSKLAIYEAPYNSNLEARRAWKAYTIRLGELLAAGKHGDALALFMQLTGASEKDIEGARQMPFWSPLEAVAPTLAYDHTALLGDEADVPVERVAQISQPVLVLNGSDSYPFMRETARALATAIPGARYQELPGQTHEVSAEALAPVLDEFFSKKG